MPLISYHCRTCGGLHQPSKVQPGPVCDCKELLRQYRREKGVRCPVCTKHPEWCDVRRGTGWLSIGYLERGFKRADAAEWYEYALTRPTDFKESDEREKLLQKLRVDPRAPTWRPDSMLNSPTAKT